MKTGLMTICAVIFVTLGRINAAVVYTDETEWLAAVGGTGTFDPSFNYKDYFKDETFDWGYMKNPNIHIESPNGQIDFGLSQVGRQHDEDQVWSDYLEEDAFTILTFDAPIYAFGAYWDLAFSGPGAGIQVYLDGQLVDSRIANTAAGTFWGIVGAPFDTIVLSPGAGTEYDHQAYEMDNMMYSYFALEIDVKPGADPGINPKSKGTTPVAIHTTPFFDATEIDPETVTLEGLYPEKWRILDCDEILDPYYGRMVGDGDLDLVLYFNTQKLADILDGNTTEAEITCFNYNELCLAGTCYVYIASNSKRPNK